jgi:hypothetical protein
MGLSSCRLNASIAVTDMPRAEEFYDHIALANRPEVYDEITNWWNSTR